MKPLVYLLFLGLLLLKNATSFVSCPFGYIESNEKCTDEIECENENPICGDNAKCFNTKGSYYCQCLKGYQSDSVHFTQEQGGPCKDINECLQSEFKCGLNTKCNNIIGSYECMCAEGFRLDNGQNTFDASHNVTCNDIKECMEYKSVCGPNTKCINTSSLYNCTCDGSFMASSVQKHLNVNQNVSYIDECTTNRSICGDNAECTNTNGSFFCTCHSGFVSSNRQEKFNSSQVKCNELTCNRLHSEGISEEVHSKELKEFVTELSSTCKRKGVTAEDLLEIVFGALDQFLTNPSLTDPKIITTLFEVVENTQALAGLLAKSSISRSSTHTQVEMLVHRNLTAPHGPISLSTEDVNFSSHWDTAVGSSYVGFASVSLFEYKSLQSHHINRTLYNMFKNKYNLNSKVVTISVTNPNTNKLNKPITVNFSNLEALKETDNYSIKCVFWNSTLDGGMWSTEGCKLKAFSTKNTVCECSHLSSFAVLMALYEVDVYELQLITWIGLSLSLICLLICILTFWLIRSIQSTRTAIHLHLCISLFIADFIFLLGISQTSNQVGCAVVAGLLHFFFLAAFCWMCLEGVQLFRMVVLVFNTTLNYGYLMAAGYGIPALIVIISASINHKGYGTKRYCWLNVEDGFIWSFFGPVCIIIVVNAVFFLITVTKLAEKFNSLNPDISNLRKIRTFTITAIAQLCVLGTMWIFGCFQFDEKTLVMSYIFTILNSLQGVLVFIMHCLLSKQVRDEYIRFLTCLTMQQKSSYTEFSTNQSSKSQVSKSIQNTGESRI